MFWRLVRLYYKVIYRFFVDARVVISRSSYIHNAATFIIADNHLAKICISDNVYIGRCANIHTNSEVYLGKNSVLSDYVYISTMSHGFNPECGPIMQQKNYDKGRVVLGENVFLGFGVTVMPNVTLGDWCIVGAGSVVTKSFPGYVMIAGNPAKVIKTYNKNTKSWIHYESNK